MQNASLMVWKSVPLNSSEWDSTSSAFVPAILWILYPRSAPRASFNYVPQWNVNPSDSDGRSWFVASTNFNYQRTKKPGHVSEIRIVVLDIRSTRKFPSLCDPWHTPRPAPAGQLCTLCKISFSYWLIFRAVRRSGYGEARSKSDSLIWGALDGTSSSVPVDFVNWSHPAPAPHCCLVRCLNNDIRTTRLTPFHPHWFHPPKLINIIISLSPPLLLIKYWRVQKKNHPFLMSSSRGLDVAGITRCAFFWLLETALGFVTFHKTLESH